MVDYRDHPDTLHTPYAPNDSIRALARMFLDDAEADAIESGQAAADIERSSATATDAVVEHSEHLVVSTAQGLGSVATDRVISSSPAPSRRSRSKRPDAEDSQDSGAQSSPSRRQRSAAAAGTTSTATQRRRRSAARKETGALSVPTDEAVVHNPAGSDAALPQATTPHAALVENHEPASENENGPGATATVIPRAELLRGMTDSGDASRDDSRPTEARTEPVITEADTRPSLPEIKPLDYDDQRHELYRLNHIRRLLATEGLAGSSIRNEADLRAALALGFAREIDPSKVPNVLVVSDPNVSQSLIDEARQDIIRRRTQAFRILQRIDTGIASSSSELAELSQAERDAAVDVIHRITPYLRDAERVFGGDNAQDALDQIGLIVHTLGLSPLTIVTAEWAVAQYYSLHVMDVLQQTGGHDSAPVQLFDTTAEAQHEASARIFDFPAEQQERVTAAAVSDRLDETQKNEIMAENEGMIYDLVRNLRRGWKHLYKHGVETDEIPQLISDWVNEQLGLRQGELEQIKEGRTWQAVHSAIENRLRSLDGHDLNRRKRPSIRMHEAVNSEVFDRLGVSLDDLIALSLKITEGRYASGYSAIRELQRYTDSLVSTINNRRAEDAARPRYLGLDLAQIRADMHDGAQRAATRVRGWLSQLSEYGTRVFDSSATGQEAQTMAYAAAQPRAARVQPQQYAQSQPGARGPVRRTPLVQQRPAQASDSHPSGARPAVAEPQSSLGHTPARGLTEERATFTADESLGPQYPAQDSRPSDVHHSATSTPSRSNHAARRELTDEEYATFTADDFIKAGHDLASLPEYVQARLSLATDDDPESAKDGFLRGDTPEQTSPDQATKAAKPNYL